MLDFLTKVFQLPLKLLGKLVAWRWRESRSV